MPHVKTEKFTSRIWGEEAEADDPFTAAKCLCAGYDVYGDLLGKINWIEYLYLLFRQHPPTRETVKTLNNVAVAIACQGPRDLATQAATSAAAGGSPLASCLMSALAVGAGRYSGAGEVFQCIESWEKFGQDLSAWQNFLEQAWPVNDMQSGEVYEHPPGFDPNGITCATPVKQTLAVLSSANSTPHLSWLQSHREQLEYQARMPLTMTGVIACALFDLGFDAQESEMLYLLLRLPGAAALALEQHWQGWQKYPFHKDGLVLVNDPGATSNLSEEGVAHRG